MILKYFFLPKYLNWRVKLTQCTFLMITLALCIPSLGVNEIHLESTSLLLFEKSVLVSFGGEGM